MQHEIITLGTTTKTPAEFRAFLDTIRGRFTQQTYNLLTHNCNNFTDECAKFLLGGAGIPAHITGLPAELMATPIGAMMRPMIEGFEQNMRVGGGGGMDPFAQAAGGGMAQPAAVIPPNPWAGVASPQPAVPVWEAGSTAVSEAQSKLPDPVTRVGDSHPHAKLALESLRANGRKLLSLDPSGKPLVEKLIAAGIKAGFPLSAGEEGLLQTCFQETMQGDEATTTAACRVVSRCMREWPEKSLLSAVWLIRWLATQPGGNSFLASEKACVERLISRLPGLPDAPRMLGLNAAANLFAHAPGAVLVSAPGLRESLLEAAAESLTAAKPMERRTAAALMVNIALGGGEELEESSYVQALCALFNALGEESDQEAITRLLVAIGWVCYGNEAACEAVENFGFAVPEAVEGGGGATLAVELRQLLGAASGALNGD